MDPNSLITARSIVRAALDEHSANAWTVAETMIPRWLHVALKRAPTGAEVLAGRSEFTTWWLELAAKQPAPRSADDVDGLAGPIEQDRRLGRRSRR